LGGDHDRLRDATSMREVGDLVKALGCDSGIHLLPV
jgi:hypothetical protein